MENKKFVNRYIGELRGLLTYVKDGFKNHLRNLSYPKEKMSMIAWIAYLSYLVANISVVMGIVSIFLFPSGVWRLFAIIGTMSMFIFYSIVMTYEPK